MQKQLSTRKEFIKTMAKHGAGTLKESENWLKAFEEAFVETILCSDTNTEDTSILKLNTFVISEQLVPKRIHKNKNIEMELSSDPEYKFRFKLSSAIIDKIKEKYPEHKIKIFAKK